MYKLPQITYEILDDTQRYLEMLYKNLDKCMAEGNDITAKIYLARIRSIEDKLFKSTMAMCGIEETFEELKLEDWMPKPEGIENKKMYICPVCKKRFPKTGYKKHWEMMIGDPYTDKVGHAEYLIKNKFKK